MKCPVCQGSDLEREDSCIVGNGKEQPTADYLCNDCGAHFEWRKGQELRIVWDPRYEPENSEEWTRIRLRAGI